MRKRFPFSEVWVFSGLCRCRYHLVFKEGLRPRVCGTHLCVEALTFAGIDASKTGRTRLGLVVLQSLGADLSKLGLMNATWLQTSGQIFCLLSLFNFK